MKYFIIRTCFIKDRKKTLDAEIIYTDKYVYVCELNSEIDLNNGMLQFTPKGKRDFK